MKYIKIFIICIISFMFLFVFGCNNKKETFDPNLDYELVLNKTNLKLAIGEVYEFEAFTDYTGVIDYELSNDNVSIEGQKLTGVNIGKCKLYASYTVNNEFYSFTMNIEVFDYYLETNDLEVTINDSTGIYLRTNYDGDINFIYNDECVNITKRNNEYFVTCNNVGEYEITSYFDINNNHYENKFKIICFKKYLVSVGDESISVKEGTKLRDALYLMFEDDLAPLEIGYTLSAYFLDEDLTERIALTTLVDKDYTLYPLCVKEEYTLNIGKVIGYKGSLNLDKDVVCIAQVCGYNINDFDLDDYKTYIVRYDLTLNNYVIKSTTQRYIPYDGFLLCIKENSSADNDLKSLLKKGLVVYLNSYNIIASSKIYINKEFSEIKNNVPTDLSVSCSFASIYDFTNDTWLFDKNGDSKAYPASTTKVITIMAALRYCDLYDTYKIADELNLCYQAPDPSVAGVEKGQIWTLNDLLYATMLPSGNDAAYSVGALTINKLFPDSKMNIRERLDTFAGLMNQIAKDCGATNSHFMVPDGNSYYKSDGSWDDRLTYHYVTANDMVKIARYAFSYSVIAQVVKTEYYGCIINGKTYSFTNTNSLIRVGSGYYYTGAVGLKTGTTGPAGYCLVSGVFKQGRFIITSCLKSTASTGRYDDTIKMLNAAFK